MGEGGHVPFLERTGGLSAAPGPIEDAAGRLLGTHRGHWRFTVGQRRGIGLARAEPLYVLATDAARNAVVVGTRGRSSPTDAVELAGARVHGELGDDPLEVRLRYRGRPLRGRAAPDARAACASSSRIPPTGSPRADRGAVPRRAPGRGRYHRALAETADAPREDEWTGLTY